MTQYFEWDPRLDQKAETFTFSLNDKDYTMQSNAGVFSKDKLDTGTRILLETVLKNEKPCQKVLDMGCGIGPVGVVLASEWDCALTMVDVNQKAIECAKVNMRNIQKEATFLCQDGIKEGMFDCIILNPPIRTGKAVIYRLFDECMAHCSGSLWIVIRKQHGAASAQKYLEQNYAVKRMGKEKGFLVFQIQNR